MCQLFGITAKKEFYINDYLKLFYANGNKHPHGWGLAFLQDGELVSEKEPLQSNCSNYLKERLAHPIETNLALAHIRYATIGNIDRNNCHPYKKRDNFGRRWTLIHNGTIFDYDKLKKYTELQRGETDSERILLYIVDEISKIQEAKNRELSFDERFELLDKTVCDMSNDNKLNLIIYDGKYLYVHTNCINSLHCLEQDEKIIFSTEPLTDENWERVKFTTLLAYKNGKLVRTGTTHSNEYIEDEDRLKFLYQIFSGL